MMKTYEWLNKAKSRFYTISVKKNKLNQIVLNHRWGGINNNRGGKKDLMVHTEEEMQKLIVQMMKRRKSRGYELVAPCVN